MKELLWYIGHSTTIDLAAPCIVAILNITPDSFADGGRLATPDAALKHAVRCVEEGASVLDIGGESTKPGAKRIDIDQQILRVVPAIEMIRKELPDFPISVDTTRAQVAQQAIDAGANIINDVSGGQEDGDMLTLAAQTGVGLVLMHRLSTPERDSFSDEYESPPEYGDVVDVVRRYLTGRLDAALAAGVKRAAVVLDPGLGFGKSVEQNLELIRRTDELCQIGQPVMSAASRKSFVGRASFGRDSEPIERLGGSIAATLLHAQAGARLFRVHDVREHASALGFWSAHLH